MTENKISDGMVTAAVYIRFLDLNIFDFFFRQKNLIGNFKTTVHINGVVTKIPKSKSGAAAHSQAKSAVSRSRIFLLMQLYTVR